MLNSKIEERCRALKESEIGKGPVIYWMSREQRIQDNWAFLYAQKVALDQKKPLLVVFCLALDYPEANLRHFSFLLKGLEEVAIESEQLNIPFFLLLGDQPSPLIKFLKKSGAGQLICDFDPLCIKVKWKQAVAESFQYRIDEVDGHNIIPCWLASDKQEYAAYTFRPKVHRQLENYLTEIPVPEPHPFPYTKIIPVKIEWQKLIAKVPDTSVAPVNWLVAGVNAANSLLRDFINNILVDYDQYRNDPNRSCQSNFSPYLHFGQISAQRIALEVKWADVPNETKDAFLEELVVRRELSDNFCFYNQDYDTFSGFPGWAKKTLDEHRNDKREYIYNLDQFENAETHDPLWNAAQKDMAIRGKLHGYLRMYWAKKILEWTESPETAIQYALCLNDKYELDGRDPNGYVGVAWSIGGVHDRAWPERKVFGKIRYMNANGCARKFNVKEYISTVDDLEVQ